METFRRRIGVQGVFPASRSRDERDRTPGGWRPVHPVWVRNLSRRLGARQVERRVALRLVLRRRETKATTRVWDRTRVSEMRRDDDHVVTARSRRGARRGRRRRARVRQVLSEGEVSRAKGERRSKVRRVWGGESDGEGGDARARVAKITAGEWGGGGGKDEVGVRSVLSTSRGGGGGERG